VGLVHGTLLPRAPSKDVGISDPICAVGGVLVGWLIICTFVGFGVVVVVEITLRFWVTK